MRDFGTHVRQTPVLLTLDAVEGFAAQLPGAGINPVPCDPLCIERRPHVDCGGCAEDAEPHEHCTGCLRVLDPDHADEDPCASDCPEVIAAAELWAQNIGENRRDDWDDDVRDVW